MLDDYLTSIQKLMALSEKLQLLERLDALINQKSTGAPKELARRLGISAPSLFRYLNHLRNLGADITFFKERMSYGYENDFHLRL